MSTTERERFKREFLDDSRWKCIAMDLLASAAALRPKVMEFWAEAHEAMKIAKRGEGLPSIPSAGIVGVYFMLTAYALENLLKAIIVEKERHELEKQLEKSSAVPNAMKTHNLRDLAALAGVLLDAMEDELLLRLTENATWRGRYPIPVHEKDLVNRYLKDGGFASQAWYSASDEERIQRIVGKVYAVA